MPGESRRAGRDLDQAVGRDGVRLALQVQRVDGLGHDGVAHQPVGLPPEEDLARSRALLQTSGDVHRVAHDHGIGGAGDHLTGVHADPAGEAHAVVAVELRV